MPDRALTARPWVLAESTWAQVGSERFDVAVLPWGATEAHNRHLPYATDTIEATAAAVEAAGRAWSAGTKVIVLPAVPFGVNTGQLDIPLCLNMNPSTQAAVLRDLVQTIERAHIRRLVIMNGHGGNDFRQIIRELQPGTDVFLCTVNWYACVDAAAYFDQPGDHAGELETSVILHLAPELVRPLHEAGPGAASAFRVRGLREGWAWAPRRWTAVTDDTGVGDPAGATEAKGRRFFESAASRLAEFLGELGRTDPDAMYE